MYLKQKQKNSSKKNKRTEGTLVKSSFHISPNYKLPTMSHHPLPHVQLSGRHNFNFFFYLAELEVTIALAE